MIIIISDMAIPPTGFIINPCMLPDVKMHDPLPVTKTRLRCKAIVSDLADAPWKQNCFTHVDLPNESGVD